MGQVDQMIAPISFLTTNTFSHENFEAFTFGMGANDGRSYGLFADYRYDPGVLCTMEFDADSILTTDSIMDFRDGKNSYVQITSSVAIAEFDEAINIYNFPDPSPYAFDDVRMVIVCTLIMGRVLFRWN